MRYNSRARFDRLSVLSRVPYGYLFNSKFRLFVAAFAPFQLPSFFRHLVSVPSLCEIVQPAGEVSPPRRPDSPNTGAFTTFACPGHCGLVERTPLSAPPELGVFRRPSSCTPSSHPKTAFAACPHWGVFTLKQAGPILVRCVAVGEPIIGFPLPSPGPWPFAAERHRDWHAILVASSLC